MEELEFKDKAGQKVQSGDFVIYGCALDRSAGLRYGKVLSLDPHPVSEYSTPRGDRNCKLRVIGVDAEWAHREPEILSKPSHVLFGDRVLKLSPEQVKESVRILLETYQPGQK